MYYISQKEGNDIFIRIDFIRLPTRHVSDLSDEIENDKIKLFFNNNLAVKILNSNMSQYVFGKK